ncbi:MAG: hypothetical protein GX483_07305 [Actinomycetaceae bacterium]|nr:hypothetical protein [Actinomycetaceae bacterium]
MDNRLAIARQTLVEAEQRAGLRLVRAQVSAAKNLDAGAVFHGEVTDDNYSVPPALTPIFPHGIPRALPLIMHGSVVAAILLAGIAVQQGAWVAIIGVRNIGWSVLQASGISAERCVYIPEASRQAAQVIAAAIEGFDVVIVGEVELDRRAQRVIERRVRNRNTVFIFNGRWFGPGEHLECALHSVSGISQGGGHIRQINYALHTRAGEAIVQLGQDGWKTDTAHLVDPVMYADASEENRQVAHSPELRTVLGHER